VVSPLGSGVPGFWDGLVAGRTAVAPITAFPAADLEPRNAAEVRDVPADDPDRAGTFALRAAGEALAHADLDGVGRGRMGVALGTTLGGMRLFERWMAREPMPPPEHVPYYAPAVRLARTLGCRGPVVTPQLACASGTHAMALAAGCGGADTGSGGFRVGARDGDPVQRRDGSRGVGARLRRRTGPREFDQGCDRAHPRRRRCTRSRALRRDARPGRHSADRGARDRGPGLRGSRSRPRGAAAARRRSGGLHVVRIRWHQRGAGLHAPM